MFLKVINTFIQQGYIKLAKSDSKYIYNNNNKKKTIPNKCCYFVLSLNRKILKKCSMVSTKILSRINVFNTFLCSASRTKVKGSCDIEDWSNGAEYLAFSFT